MSNRVIQFSGSGATDHIRLPPGRYTIDLELGGSTVSLQARAYNVPDLAFKTLTLPDDTTSTSTDAVIEAAGGLEYRLNVTSFVAAGGAYFSGIEN